jgi:hypothetical protein
MKPLFYMHSLFCPNDCDLKSKKEKEWQRNPNGAYSYMYQVLPPGTPYPEDATRFYLMGKVEVDARKKIDVILTDHPGNHYSGYEPTIHERNVRNDSSLWQSEHWVFAIKD